MYNGFGTSVSSTSIKRQDNPFVSISKEPQARREQTSRACLLLSASLGLQHTSVWVGGCKMCVSSYYSSLAEHTAERDRSGNKERGRYQEELAVNGSCTWGFLALNTFMIASDASVKWGPPLQHMKHKFQMKTHRRTFLRCCGYYHIFWFLANSQYGTKTQSHWFRR